MFLSLFLVATALHASRESSAEVNCPGEIEVMQTASAVDGWSIGKAKTKQKLDGVEVFYGSIENGLQLVVPSWIEDNIQTTQWQVAGSGTEVWLRCHYRDTTITLDKRLDPRIVNCRQRRGALVFEVSCK